MDVIVVVIVVVVLGLSAVVAVASLFGPSGYGTIGSGGLAPPAPEHESAELREADVRQMLEVRQQRRIARGEAGGHIEAELQELLARGPSEAVSEGGREGSASPATAGQPAEATPEAEELRADARAVVETRRARRRRRGEPEGDLEAEVTALLEELGG